MVEIDMTHEGDDMLVGVNLWDVNRAYFKKSQKGDDMLVLELGNGNAKLVDRLMIQGRGWPIARKKLLALGMPEDFRGALDPVQFINRRVWVATKIDEREGIDNRTGAKVTYRNLAVDVNALRCNGYQPEAELPAGCVMPDSNVPF